MGQLLHVLRVQPGVVSPLAASSDNELLTSSGFVGRQKELTELKVALDEALSGQGGMVMLVGEPGIGKTRLAQELAPVPEASGTWRCAGDTYQINAVQDGVDI